MGLPADLPGRSLERVSHAGRWGLSVSSERSCHRGLGLSPSTIGEGSAGAIDSELVGHLIVCQPGPGCSRLLNREGLVILPNILPLESSLLVGRQDS